MRRVFSIGLLIILAACGRAEQPKQVAAPVPQVRIATIGVDESPANITGVGSVALRREASLGFTSAGRIARLTVNEGDLVRRGQVLAALDVTTVAADLKRARAERDRAAAEFQRSANLMEKGWITRPRLENAQASLRAADASVSAASFQASNATILAPGNGVVLSRAAEPGQVVAAGTPILVIGEITSGYVLRVPLSDQDAAHITRGTPATVRLAALDNQSLAGRVTEIGGRSDQSTGTFAVEIGLPEDRRLKSGQIGEAVIASTTARVADIRVPAAAVFAPRGGEGFVFVFDRQTRRLKLRKVAVGEAEDNGIRVLSGLSRGELVAVSRVDRLKDGMKIEPIGRAR